MLPYQTLISSIGRKLMHNNRCALPLLRQHNFRKHSILCTNNSLILPRFHSTLNPPHNNFYTLSSPTLITINKHPVIFHKNVYSSQSAPPQTSGQKFKKAVAEYGSVVIIFHVSISLTSLGICYSLISSGLDLAAIVSYMGLNLDIENKLATNTGTFVVAYAVHKVFAPLRMAITLAATPFIVKYLRKIGWLKVPTDISKKNK